MLDLVVRGGTAVTPAGVGPYDLGIAGERIVAVTLPGQLPEAVRVIDANGKIVIPGGVEPHAHVGAPISTAPQYESSGPEDVSRAALFGGTTTVLDFAYQVPGLDLEQSVEERHKRWSGRSYADYSYHLTPFEGVTPETIAQLGGLIDQGFATVKIFTTAVRP